MLKTTKAKPKISYKTVKYCLLCRKRFFVMKGERMSNYCKKCQEKVFGGKKDGRKC